jgi:hypothetical protein
VNVRVMIRPKMISDTRSLGCSAGARFSFSISDTQAPFLTRTAVAAPRVTVLTGVRDVRQEVEHKCHYRVGDNALHALEPA